MHLQQNYPTFPFHPPSQTVSVLAAIEQWQIHARWGWDSYVYCPDTPFGEYCGKLLLITAPKSHRDRPITALDLNLSTLLPPGREDQDSSTWNITEATGDLNL